MSQVQVPQSKSKLATRWTKVKVATVVAIVVLSVVAAASLWFAWDYRGAKNRAQHTLIVDMTNSLSTVTIRIDSVLDDSNSIEMRSSEAWWGYQLLDRLQWNALAVGDMFTDSSSTKRIFNGLASAFDDLKMAVTQAQAQVAASGDVEESLNAGLEDSIGYLNLLYQELWDAMDKSFSWSDYPPSTVKYIDLEYVEELAAEIRASV
ncbi:MAG: hypothetical protein MUC90_06090 [Thermoplasmata archaeon]|nr:hypothetical protein [Thermoplasmata archaeon]